MNIMKFDSYMFDKHLVQCTSPIMKPGGVGGKSYQSITLPMKFKNIPKRRGL